MQRSILNILVFSTLDQLYISLRWLAMKEKSLTKLLLFLDFGPNSSRETTCVFKFPMNVFNVQCNLKWQPGKVWPFWEKMKSTLDHLISPPKNWLLSLWLFWGLWKLKYQLIEEVIFCQVDILNESIDRVWSLHLAPAVVGR